MPRHTMITTHRPRSLGIAALLFATSAWGGMFLVSKSVLHHVDPFWFTLIGTASRPSSLLR